MIYIISDTHFNHDKMIEYCGRPKNFNEILWSELDKLNDDDCLIHLGDICIGGDTEVHERLSQYNFKKILVRGNHDKKSNSWYMAHGWDFVCDRFDTTYDGVKIAFSHRPLPWDGMFDRNVHGHLHDDGRKKRTMGFWVLYSPENENYIPVSLSSLIF